MSNDPNDGLPMKGKRPDPPFAIKVMSVALAVVLFACLFVIALGYLLRLIDWAFS